MTAYEMAHCPADWPLKRLDVFMQDVAAAPASPWASPVWVPAGVIVALAVGLPLVWLTWRLVFGRIELMYSILEMPLAGEGVEVADEIQIYHGTRHHPLKEPQVVRVRLINRSSRDIPTAAFDDHRALTLDFGTSIIGILNNYGAPNRAAAPSIRAVDSKLQVLPDLIHRKETIIVDMLVDGAIDLRIDCPLIDVKFSRYPWSEPFGPWWRAPQLYRALALIAILIVLLVIGVTMIPRSIQQISPNLLPMRNSNSVPSVAPSRRQSPKWPGPKQSGNSHPLPHAGAR
jgi:hypothetical protein